MEVDMKRIRLTVFLLVTCMLFLLAGQTAFGATKIVKFQVPVKDVDSNWMLHWVKVTYDDQATTVETLIKNLAHEGFYVEGQPEFLQ
jgi:hypothetical protein